MTEAEIRVMQPQTKEWWQPWEAQSDEDQILPWNLHKAHSHHLDFSPARLILNFWPLELWKNKFVLI